MLEKLDVRIEGRLIIENRRLTVDLRTGYVQAANISVPIDTEANLDLAVETACHALATQLRREYFDAQVRELERHARVSTTVSAITADRTT